MIDTRDLTVRFGAVTALSIVNITIRTGTIQALAGKNASDKKTLLKTLGFGEQPR